MIVEFYTLRFLFVFCALMLLSAMAFANGVTFRYLPGRPDISSPMVIRNVNVGPLLELTELPARGPGGWGMSAPFSAEFDDDAAILYSADTVSVRQIIGPRMTVECWFMPFAVSDTVHLLSNQRWQSDSDGFTLYLEQGLPVFAFTFGSKSYVARGQSALLANEKYWLSASVNYSGSSIELHLYVNGRRVAETEESVVFTDKFTLTGPFFIGTKVTGDAPNIEMQSGFAGNLFGAVAKVYVAPERYLNTPAAFDGSGYFGLPMYHDYPIGSTSLPADIRISASETELGQSVFVPYTNDFYILQGIAGRHETIGDEAISMVYMSAYHRLRDGSIETQNSIAVEMDATRDLMVRRCFRLAGVLKTAHVGGVAYGYNALYVASRGLVERYPLPAYQDGDDKYIDLLPDPAGAIDVLGSASFVSMENDTLWVGDFRWPEEGQGYLYGYPMMGNGFPVSGQPPRIYALPKRVQGVDFFTFQGQRFCFMSLSGSSTVSELLRVRAEDLRANQIAPIDTTFILPRGGEDLAFFPDGTLWSGSESGSDHFQKRPSPWAQFFPFIYSIPPQVLFGDIAPLTGIREQAAQGQPQTPNLQILSYPNPFNNHLRIVIDGVRSAPVNLRVVDVLGREIAQLLHNVNVAGTHALNWDASAVPSGQYFLVLESAGDVKVASSLLIK